MGHWTTLLDEVGSMQVLWVVLLWSGNYIVSVASQLPVPCTDLRPIYLLHKVAPDKNSLPPGVEIVYDDTVGIHAFHFTQRVQFLSFPAAAVFRYCEYFPEEFSLLVTLRLEEWTGDEALEALFALTDLAASRLRLAVRVHRRRLLFDYFDRLTKRTHTVEFRSRRLFDGDWHTAIFSVTGSTVSLRIDCGRPRVKTLKRVFPAFLSTRGAHFYVANMGSQKGVFTGYLKQLLILPGSDAATIACPSSQPNFPELSNLYPTDPPTDDHTQRLRQSICTWRDTGKLFFDVYAKTLMVCFSGVWQTVLLPPDERVEKRLDYIEWHQDIITAAPTIDLELFRVPGEGLFMATASYSDQREVRKQQSAVFKWVRDKFVLYQSLYTLGAQAWEHFTIGSNFFLAVANQGPRRDRPSKSVIYRWSKKRKRFGVFQELVTWTSRDIEYFQIEGQHYLAIANHVQGQLHAIDSVIYRYSESERRFEAAQNISSVGAYDWTFFELDGFSLLALANSFSGAPLSSTKLDSAIYFWQNGKFVPFQKLETTGATDWEFFSVDADFFLVVSNAFNFGPHTDEHTERYRTNSTIYKLNRARKQFDVFQELDTFSAIDWEFFTVGPDSYLIVSNAQQHLDSSSPLSYFTGTAHSYTGPLEKQHSVIYRWQGVEKFVPVHYLDTLPSADWEVFDVDGDTYLVYANAKDSISQLLKVKFV